MLKNYIRQNYPRHKYLKRIILKLSKRDWTLPGVITLIGVIGSIIIGLFQMRNTKNIALNERKMKMWEIFSKEDFLHTEYKDSTVWKSEGSVRLLGAMLSDTSILENESERKLARAVFEQIIMTAIHQFHRTEDIRLAAARVVASMYFIDKKFVINRLIEEIRDTTYPGYNYINGGVVVTLARIPDYWEGSKQQYQKVEQLRNHKFLGDTNITKDYKNGWLNNEALKKWKEVY
jgi:hypothetical protein